jgi:hydroxymethylbilane synthase
MTVLRLGSRRSALAQVQALQVGAALRAIDPGLRIDYRFIESSGDLSANPDAGLVTARCGFTEDLGRLLDHGAIDLAVHSWKDLPLPSRGGTRVAATLPRADARDVLLLRRSSLQHASEQGLKILSSSARRRQHLEDFLAWALPVKVPEIRFAPVRGDIARRLTQLLTGCGDGLVIAKAALDRLLVSDPPNPPALQDAQRVVRRALQECRAMVLPLQYCPAAPAQAALALEVRDDSPFGALWRAVNHEDTFELVTAERRIAASYGDDEPLGITRLRQPYGDIEYRRSARDPVAAHSPVLRRRGLPLPRPQAAARIWCGDESPDSRPQRRTLDSAPRSFRGTQGLLIARHQALPEGATVDEHAVLWTPGLATWRELAARGYWVVGSDESLGESGAAPIRAWYPGIERWIKLTHDRGHGNGHADLVPTYQVAPRTRFVEVARYTHFFWRSGSQLRDYLQRFPGLAAAWHGCGPGNTFRIASGLLSQDRLRPFLGPEQFRTELTT